MAPALSIACGEYKMPDDKRMSANSLIVLECLIVLTAFGILSFFQEPKYGMGVGLIIAALIGLLNNAAGVKSGSKMPEQAGEPKPGQTSQVETRIQTDVPPTTP